MSKFEHFTSDQLSIELGKTFPSVVDFNIQNPSHIMPIFFRNNLSIEQDYHRCCDDCPERIVINSWDVFSVTEWKVRECSNDPYRAMALCLLSLRDLGCLEI